MGAQEEVGVRFKINGKEYNVGRDVNPHTRLVDFLRRTALLTGTKVMCREGGCGACIVNLATVNPATGEKTFKAINSCLLPLFSCNGCEIITVEGIGNKSDGYHPVQSQLADFNGSQCGYCSPGMVMSMYSLLEEKEGCNITGKDVEQAIDGNICRCTGYRPIMDAFKTFAEDASEELKSHCPDLEDIGQRLQSKRCAKSGSICNGDCKSSGKTECSSAASLQIGNWYQPPSMKALQNLLRSFGNKLSYRLVAGNTGTGIYKNEGPYEAYIDINRIAELHDHSLATPVTVGGGMSLRSLQEILSSIPEKNHDYWYGPILAKHIGLIGSVPLRNAGSIAGNLMLKNAHREFPSDLFIALETVGAKVVIEDCEGERMELSLMDFLDMNMRNKIIVALCLPPLSSEKRVLKTYKIMPRAQNAHAYINAGFSMKIDKEKNMEIVEKPTVIFGGINEHFVHAKQTEDFLVGKCLGDEKVLKAALKILDEELDPVDDLPNPDPDFRKSLALGLFYKFVLLAVGERADAKLRSGSLDLDRGVSSGKQDFEMNTTRLPIHQPLLKLEARAQCSGEAQYIDDIPVHPDELHAAFVVSTRANCRIESIEASEALKSEGVVAFLNSENIKYENLFAAPGRIFDCVEIEEVFCSGKVLNAGQPIGLIVARTQREAIRAASLVRVNYTDCKKPVLTIKDALKYPERVRLQTYAGPPENLSSGNIDDAFSSSELIVEGELQIGSQYHMFIEPHITTCVPTEDGMDVYSATQDTDYVQHAVAASLNLEVSQVNMQVRRVGGAFGGKQSRAGLVAVACAMAASKLKKPVRLQLDLQASMSIMGGRLPYYCKYKAGVDTNGQLTGVEVDLYSDCGSDFNEGTAFLAGTYVRSCYEAKAWKITPYIVKTDTPSNTYCRAPGTSQAIAIMENIMEHVANVRKEDPLEFRLKNLIPPITIDGLGMQNVIQQLRQTSDYDLRKSEVEAFNKDNRWKKRGIQFYPMLYKYDYPPFRYNVLIAIYHHDGSVAVSHGGIECGQGINTKVAQVVAHELGIPISKIKVKASNTLTNANASPTGGSMTSETNCYAAIVASRELKERMRPIKEKLGDVDWLTLIKECHNNNVDLTARHFYTPADKVKGYNIHAGTVAEVELDILTGEKLIRRVDILEDAGQSLNPLIDIGQIEGAFMMGVGLWTSERCCYDPETGRKLTVGTWDYKPPMNKDIPVDFRVALLKNTAHSTGVLGSKATGEPPLSMGASVFFALRNALESVRRDMGDMDWFQFDGPGTIDRLLKKTLVTPSQFSF